MEDLVWPILEGGGVNVPFSREFMEGKRVKKLIKNVPVLSENFRVGLFPVRKIFYTKTVE